MEKSDNINTVILGTGNILLGDEGIGVHVINRLKEEKLPQGVLIVDGSTAGFRLIDIFESYKNSKFIIIDALKITSGFPADSDVNSNSRNAENKKNNSIKDGKSNRKGDIYSISLKEFYNIIDCGCRSRDFISFHQTGLTDVLKLLLLAYSIKIDGFLISINIGDNSKQNSTADAPAFSLKLTDEIEKKIPAIIELVKSHI